MRALEFYLRVSVCLKFTNTQKYIFGSDVIEFTSKHCSVKNFVLKSSTINFIGIYTIIPSMFLKLLKKWNIIMINKKVVIIKSRYCFWNLLTVLQL